jgi:FAD/FMN-containing dehydrogenase
VERRRKHWGWGYEDEQPTLEELRGAARFLAGRLGFGSSEPEPAVPLEELTLPAPRLRAPGALEAICAIDDYERALHCYGRAYGDVVRAFRGRFEHPPDVVAHPRDERELQATLDWAVSAGAAVIPFVGGTSVVGGVEAGDCEDYAGVVTIDLKALDRVLEVDPVSLAARIQAGATGPGVEAQLGAHGLTLRHFPQSFELSTLGGWIATRAGGHFATLYTHIDDLIESLRALTPAGTWESRRLPGSGAGVSPDRMLIGSEGTLGVITEAWERRGTGTGTRQGGDAVGSWREAFLRAPYLRDVFIATGVLSETFETAITWDRFPAFHDRVLSEVRDAVRDTCGEGSVTCRFTHVYPDGPAAYHTVLAPARRGAELEQWAAIKRAASEAVIEGGGTITHHHAVGRTHRHWYDRQRPEPFATALRAAKAALDPSGALNPGVLIDP